jgi:hypothetical protein
VEVLKAETGMQTAGFTLRGEATHHDIKKQKKKIAREIYALLGYYAESLFTDVSGQRIGPIFKSLFFLDS